MPLISMSGTVQIIMSLEEVLKQDFIAIHHLHTLILCILLSQLEIAYTYQIKDYTTFF